MRDWNLPIRPAAPCAIIPFVAYLWGIETGDPYMPGGTPDLVCSLPMRDWNKYMTEGASGMDLGL